MNWNKSHPARKLLYDEIKAGRIPLNEDDMGPAEVYYTYHETLEFQEDGMAYGKVFARRLSDLRKQIKRETEPKGPEWNEEHPARILILNELKDGRIPLSTKKMGPAEVYCNYAGTFEFKIEGMEYGDTFIRRLRSLRQQVKRDKGRARSDMKALMIAMKNHPAPSLNHRGEPQWNGSAAQRLLKEDIAAGKHLAVGFKPSKLRLDVNRPEYRAFSVDTFRWKVQQEVRTKKYLYTLKYRSDEKLQATFDRLCLKK